MLKRSFFLLLAIALLQLLLLTSAGAQTIISGENENNYIDSTTHWTLANSPYIVNDDVEVAENANLLIEPGVIVKFKSGIGLFVNGTLGAPGTADKPIYFTSYRDDSVAAGGDTDGDGGLVSAQAGDWGRMGISGTAVLKNCFVRYGGSDDYRDGMIWKDGGGNLSLTNCTVSDSKHNNLSISGSTGSHSINNCVFENSGNYDIYVWDINNDFFTGEGNTLTSNPKVYIEYGTIAKQNGITFKQEFSPYLIGGEVIVGQNSSLKVEPGVVIKFNNGVGLGVDGTLDAQGTENQPIYFTSYKDDTVGGDTDGDGGLVPAQAGDWGKMGISGTAVLKNCFVRYGGSDDYRDGMIWKDGGGNLSLTNCTISDSKHNSLSFSGSTGAQSINNCVFENSGKYDVYIWDIGNDFFTGEGNTLTSNPKVYIEYGTISDNDGVTFKQEFSPYLIGADVVVGENSSLKVEPGVVIKFSERTGLSVDGTLNALGTADQPIYFTSLKDDNAGGDTNGDGSTTSPKAGDWNSINISGNAYLDNCFIIYGGQEDYGKSMMLKSGAGELSLTNSTVSNSKYSGLSISNSTGNHTVTGNEFCYNAESGIYLWDSVADIFKNKIHNNKVGISCEQNSNPVIGGSSSNANQIFNNTDYGVQNIDVYEPNVINARYNWWGDASGPTHSTNPQGRGDNVSEYVNFSNFITSDNGPVKVDPNKIWTIHFNMPVDITTITDNIFVKDSSGSKVIGITVTPGEEDEFVSVNPPQGNYVQGNTYTLYVTTGVKSSNGKYLREATSKEFAVQ